MKMKVIACRVMVDEMRSFLRDDVEVQVLEISQHVRPKQLKIEIQAAVDRIDGTCEVILLGYGLCSNSVLGLSAKKSKIVIPKLHDCIGVFLGSHRAYLNEMDREPAFFLTQGYIRGYESDQGSPLSELERLTERYGKEKAEMLMNRIMGSYKRLVYIQTPQATDIEGDRAYSKRFADRFQMRYEEVPGTPELIRRLVSGDWNDDFVVVEPGTEVKLEHFSY